MPIDRDDIEADDPGDFEDGAQVEGSEKAMKKLLPFLEKWTSKNVESENVSYPVHLFQTAHGNDKPLKRFEFTVGADEEEEFINHLLDVAEDDASKYPGTTRYAVKLTVNGTIRQMNFALSNLVGMKGNGERSLSDELNDPRTLSGHVGQMMRHTEAFADKLIHQSTSNQDVLREENRELRTRVRELEQQNREMIPLLHQVHDMSFRKEHAIEQMRFDQEQKRAVTGMLMQALPHLASGMLGGGFASLLGMGGGQAADQQVGGSAGQPGAPPGFGGFGQPPPTQQPPNGVVTGAVQQGPEYPILVRIAMHVEGLLASLASNPQKLQGIAQYLEPMDQMTVGELHAGIEQLRSLRTGANGQAVAAPPAPMHTQAPNGNGGNGYPGNGGRAYPPQTNGGFVPFGGSGNPNVPDT